MTFREMLAAALIVVATACASPAQAQVAKPWVVDTAKACSAMTLPENTTRFARIEDAPTAIKSATIIPAGGNGSKVEDDLPEICRIEGHVAPQVGFLLRLPTKNWNGKFMMGGCGGPCGNYLEDRIDHALVRGYAVVSTDMGHKGGGWLFAYNNPQGVIDFAYRSTHVTAIAAKQLIAAFYSVPASRNYFMGCSTGGRQAMVTAQRFPKDFDGIIAGAPVYDEIGDAPHFLEWNVRANMASDGSQILPARKLPMLHKAVLDACDAKDGLKDGLLQDPHQCRWQPRAIQCAAADEPTCLTRDQVAVVEKIYSGATNSKGEPLYWGMVRGSEDQWSPLFISEDGSKPFMGIDGTSITGYLGFEYGGGPRWSITDYDYDRDPQRLLANEYIYSARNPDLTGFRRAGGKLILFTGWNDNNIPADATIDYYNKATRVMGGAGPTKEFFRLFLLPTVNHCRGGEGGGEADWITALENWVEKGQAPDQVVAYHKTEPYPVVARSLQDYGAIYSKLGRHPMPRSEYDRARPVYAYPDVARWTGRGDAADPATWTKAKSVK